MQVGLLACKFLGSDEEDGGYISDAIKCIDWCKGQGAHIISASWGSSNISNSRALEWAIANSDALFVAAAGNEKLNIDIHRTVPAAFDLPNLISVAASRYDKLNNL